ncbi:MAG TPA: hypothetical protein VF933_37920 [Streptosporangiaceae bacterium]
MRLSARCRCPDVLVTPASVQDRDAARPLLFNLARARRRVRRAWADSVYAGKLQPWAATYLKLTVEIVKRPGNLHTFQVLPRRWVVVRGAAPPPGQHVHRTALTKIGGQPTPGTPARTLETVTHHLKPNRQRSPEPRQYGLGAVPDVPFP